MRKVGLISWGCGRKERSEAAELTWARLLGQGGKIVGPEMVLFNLDCVW